MPATSAGMTINKPEQLLNGHYAHKDAASASAAPLDYPNGLSIVTPFGGVLSAGTKKSCTSFCVGSTRYRSKSVTPFSERNVSSIKKLPVNSRAGLANAA